MTKQHVHPAVGVEIETDHAARGEQSGDVPWVHRHRRSFRLPHYHRCQNRQRFVDLLQPPSLCERAGTHGIPAMEGCLKSAPRCWYYTTEVMSAHTSTTTNHSQIYIACAPRVVGGDALAAKTGRPSHAPLRLPVGAEPVGAILLPGRPDPLRESKARNSPAHIQTIFQAEQTAVNTDGRGPCQHASKGCFQRCPSA